MKRSIFIISLLWAVSSAWAVVITDDFTRADTPQTNDTSLIGADWKQDSAINEYLIQDGFLHARPFEGEAVLYNDALQTISGNGTNFTLQVDVAIKQPGHWAGIAFNYQDADNFYSLRILEGTSQYQVLANVGGSIEVLVNGSDATIVFQEDIFYTMTVTSRDPYNFDFTIRETGTMAVHSGRAVDTANHFTGGYAGFYTPLLGHSAKYDNFNLEVGLAPVVWADADNFNRVDVFPQTTDTTKFGAHWKQEVGSANEWFIQSGQLGVRVTTADAVLYNDLVQTISGNGTNFTLQADVMIKELNYWAGVAFNYQDEDNFYCVRFKEGTSQYQVLAVVGGTPSVLVSASDATITFQEDIFYTVTVTSRNLYNFDFMITEVGSTVAVNPSSRAVDGATHFTGGYAGFYAPIVSFSARYDNFSIVVEPTEFVLEESDNFNRANVFPQTTDTTLIGAMWKQEAGSPNEWFIQSGQLGARRTSGNPVLFNDTVPTVSGNNTNFTLQVDVMVKDLGQLAGVAFNYQNEDNFYALIFKEGTSQYRIIRMFGGTPTDLLDETDASITFAEDIFYTVTVTSETAYDFDFTITEVGSATVLNSTTNLVDGTASFTGGYAGLYAPVTGFSARYDNFSLSLQTFGYDAWAKEWGVDIGATTDDYDQDGLSNLYEYGLEGDPTNALDQGTSPVFAIVDEGGSDVVQYIHPQLSDLRSGIAYSLELTTDLVTGTWINSGYMVTGTNVTVGELDFVTNITDTVAGEKFIRLIIE